MENINEKADRRINNEKVRIKKINQRNYK